jgi:predicted transcriptional regulator
MVNMKKDEQIKLIHAILNTTRKEIIVCLLKKKLNISDLNKELGIAKIDRSTLCYHLNIMEEAGLLRSEYRILEQPHSKGRAGRVYDVNRERLLEFFAVTKKFNHDLSRTK